MMSGLVKKTKRKTNNNSWLQKRGQIEKENAKAKSRLLKMQ